MGTLLDLIVPPVLTAASAIFAGAVAIYAPKFLAAFQNRTGIQLSENQRQVVLGAVATAAGTLETSLDNGVLRTGHIAPLNASVREQASAVIKAVPIEADAMHMTIDSLSRMIVGKVNTAAHPGPVVVLPAKGNL